MLIILEGPDLAGKTTLSRQLLTHFGKRFHFTTPTLLHRGPPSSHPIDEYVTPLLGYRPGSGQHIVCDRWHIGEIVYPRVTGRLSMMTPDVFQHIEAFLHSRGALLVHVWTTPETLTERYASRGDLHRTVDEVLRADREYHSVIPQSTLSKMIHGSYTVQSIENVALSAEHQAQIRMSEGDRVSWV